MQFYPHKLNINVFSIDMMMIGGWVIFKIYDFKYCYPKCPNLKYL